MRTFIVVISLLGLGFPALARDKTECDFATKKCVTVPYSAQEEAAANAEIEALKKTQSLSAAEKLHKFLAEKFNMTPDQVKSAIESQK